MKKKLSLKSLKPKKKRKRKEPKRITTPHKREPIATNQAKKKKVTKVNKFNSPN